MKRFALILITALLALSINGLAFAKGPPTVVINGGGIAVNNNSGVFPDALTIGKVTALMKGGKVRGMVKARTVLTADPTVTVAAIRGKVVCMEELDNFVWEVRFEVVRAAGAADGLVGAYGSVFVFDGGNPGAGNDFIDESFSTPADEECGNLVEGTDFGLEPVIAGNFKVRQR